MDAERKGISEIIKIIKTEFRRCRCCLCFLDGTVHSVKLLEKRIENWHQMLWILRVSAVGFSDHF